MVKRIASQRSTFSKIEVEKDFKSSREILKRIEKFNGMKKINSKLEENLRLRT